MTDRRIPGNEEIIDSIEEIMRNHISDEHVFEVSHLNNLVAEHREMYDMDRPLLRDTNKKVNLLVSEMYGMPKPTAADPDHREGGIVVLLERIEATLDLFQSQAKNGGIETTRKWTSGQWYFYGALATGWFLLVGTVIAAVWP